MFQIIMSGLVWITRLGHPMYEFRSRWTPQTSNHGLLEPCRISCLGLLEPWTVSSIGFYLSGF